MTGRELHWKIEGRDVVIRIEETTNGQGTLHLNDQSIGFTVRDRQATGGFLEVHGRNHHFFVHRNGKQVTVWLNGQTYRMERMEKGRLLEEGVLTHGSGEVRSLMPGKVLRVDVRVGDTVSEQQTVVLMESMKMETSLTAPHGGTVTAVHCQPGQTVDMGEILVVIEFQQLDMT